MSVGRRNTGLNSAASAASQIFDGSLGTVLSITLTADTTITALANLLPGEIYTIFATQDGTGGRSLNLPITLSGSPAVLLGALEKSTITFVATSGSTGVLVGSSATAGPVAIATGTTSPKALKYGTVTKLSGAAASATLPTAASGPGQWVGIDVTAAIVITVTSPGGETIDGAASYVSDGTAYFKAWFLSDGTNWIAYPKA